MTTIPVSPAAYHRAAATSVATALQPSRPCPECCGEGYLVHVGAPGYFDDHAGCWMPSETLDPCDACHGTGHEPVTGAHPSDEASSWLSHAQLHDPECPLDF